MEAFVKIIYDKNFVKGLFWGGGGESEKTLKKDPKYYWTDVRKLSKIAANYMQLMIGRDLLQLSLE